MKCYFLFYLLLFILFFSCKKSSVKPPSVTIKNNVFVIDSTKLQLVSTNDQLNQGIYVFMSTTTFPNFVDSGIIVGTTGEGYLRKITSITKQTGTIILSTQQACFEDVFQQGSFSVITDLTGLQRSSLHSSNKLTDNDYSVVLSPNVICQQGPITISAPGQYL